MTWVLIYFWLTYGPRGSTATAEFDSEAACRGALQAIHVMAKEHSISSSVLGVCVPKGAK